MRRRWGLKVVKVAVVGLVACTVFGFIVMGLWNWLAPAMFGGRTITFWQALGLLILARILVGGFHHGGHGMHWRRRMMERYERMTPEEREKFREGIRARCGRRGMGNTEAAPSGGVAQ